MLVNVVLLNVSECFIVKMLVNVVLLNVSECCNVKC